MNWPFWSLRQAKNDLSKNDPCESIQPLLPLCADRMASPEEVRRVEAHLPGCEGCREALSWMQATHRALAARPVALPPADLHSRIAQAIAASSAAPVSSVPGVLRPAYSFRLRPAYAAAASVTVLGAALSVSYPLWHSAGEAGVKPAPQPVHFASARPAVKPHSLVRTHVLPAHTSVASVTPETKEPAIRLPAPARKTTPASIAVPKERVAESVPVPTLHLVPTHVQTVGHPPAVTHEKMASLQAAPTEKHQPQVLKTLKAPSSSIAPKLPDAPLMARREKETISVPIKVEPPIVVEQAPQVRTASLASASDDPLGAVKAKAKLMRTEAFAKTHLMERQASSSLANAARSLDPDHIAVYNTVYSDTAAK